jgi:hypothetical protein
MGHLLFHHRTSYANEREGKKDNQICIGLGLGGMA